MKINSLAEAHLVILQMLREVHRIASKHDVPYFLAYGTALGAVRNGEFIPWDDDADIHVPWGDVERLCAALREELPEPFEVFDLTTPGYDHLIPRVGAKGVDQNVVHVDVNPLIGSPRSAVAKRVVTALVSVLTRGYMLKRSDAGYRYPHSWKKRWSARLVKTALVPVPAALFRRIYLWLGEVLPYPNGEGCYSIGGLLGDRDHLPSRFFTGTTQGTLAGHTFNLPSGYEEYLAHNYGDDYLTPIPQQEQAKLLDFFERVELPKILRQQNGAITQPR